VKYLGCIAAAPVLGKDAVTDVSAFAFQMFIQLVADGGSANDGSCDIGQGG
jgi:hypothetical protein